MRGGKELQNYITIEITIFAHDEPHCLEALDSIKLLLDKDGGVSGYIIGNHKSVK